MTGENVALNLLNRTKYAQNRTKFYTVRNTVLSQTERPLFVTGSLQDVAVYSKSLFLRKSFQNRRSSKRGPFQRLSLPHEYFKTLGDPLYYSNQDLVSSCVTASSENMCDSYFWKQICEKIREVRDVIPISDLLKCLISVTKVNYYDRDLFRVLSREFVDDMNKLSLDEVSQLLHCYYKQNVYSYDLINSVGSRVITGLEKELSDLQKQNSDQNTQPSGLLGRLKGIIPSNKPLSVDFSYRHISRICKYCHYFNYSNPDFYLLIANVFVSNSKNMDLVSRLEMFTYLDPKKMKMMKDITNSSDSQLDSSLSNNLVDSDLMTSILDSMDGFDPSQLHHENSYELGVFLSSQMFRDSEHSKTVHDLCSVCSSCSTVSSAIFRYLSNCFYLNCGWRDSVESLLTLLSNCFSELVPLMSKISSLDHLNPVKSPFTLSLEHMFMNSLLTCNRVLNSCWRLKLGCVNESQNLDSQPHLSFTLKDNNIHSSFLREFPKLSFSETELGLLSRISTSLNLYGCKGQSVKNLASSFESFNALVTNKKTLSLSSKLVGDLTKSLELISLEIIRQLVDFDTDSLYRVALSLNSTETHTNSHLSHYLKTFPKLTRTKSNSNSVTFSNPFINI